MNHLKTLALAAALAVCTTAAHADIRNVDIYGVVAFYTYSSQGGTTAAGAKVPNETTLENESRIGFRGSKELKNGPKLFWQFESGYLGYAGNDLGARDTFVGIEGGFGKIRAGRLLTPLYETIDWPYSNPGLGNIFDWGNNIDGGGNLDRQSDQLRWDIPAVGDLTSSVAIGRGARSSARSHFVSGIVHYKLGGVTLHGGAEFDGNKPTSTAGVLSDSTNWLLAFEAPVGGGLSFWGAYKDSSAAYSNDAPDQKQADVSLGAVYGAGDWQHKLGFTKNGKLKIGGAEQSGTDASIVSVQSLYFLDPAAVAYVRFRHASKFAPFKNNLMLGMEYYF